MVSALANTLHNLGEVAQYGLPIMVVELSSVISDVHVVVEIFNAPQASQTQWSLPDIVEQKNQAVNGPRLDSHPIQPQFPEVVSSGDSLEIRDLFQFVITSHFDDFVGRS